MHNESDQWLFIARYQLFTQAYLMTEALLLAILNVNDLTLPHFIRYIDVIMGAMATQITSLTIVHSTIYWGTDKKNIKAPCHWPLCGEFNGARWIPRTNG